MDSRNAPAGSTAAAPPPLAAAGADAEPSSCASSDASLSNAARTAYPASVLRLPSSSTSDQTVSVTDSCWSEVEVMTDSLSPKYRSTAHLYLTTRTSA